LDEAIAMKRVFTMVIFCIICVLAHQANATSIKPFTISSRQEIEKMHQGRAFILAFWSLDCVYCLDELAILAKFTTQHPKVKLVMVNTDGQSTASEINQALKKFNLPANIEMWQFSESDDERLRYSIDKQWYGELPRTYYYDKAHQIKSLSGSPDEGWLKQWGKSL
jgi:thiol-disulfide isomerase/thioredoxin